MAINGRDLAKMVEATNFKVTATKADMDELVQACKDYDFGVCVGVQSFVPYLLEQLKDTKTVVLGGGGSRGPDRTEFKVAQAARKAALGCGTIENRLNLSWVKDRRWDLILLETQAMRAVVPGKYYKVLIETPLLTDDEIHTICDVLIDGGVDSVKSASGEVGPTTIHHIEEMSKAIKGRVGIKAAGGIRSIETVDAMLNLGVDRFGISLASAIAIVESAMDR